MSYRTNPRPSQRAPPTHRSTLPTRKVGIQPLTKQQRRKGKRQRQQEKRRYWRTIHLMRQAHPHLSIMSKFHMAPQNSPRFPIPRAHTLNTGNHHMQRAYRPPSLTGLHNPCLNSIVQAYTCACNEQDPAAPGEPSPSRDTRTPLSKTEQCRPTSRLDVREPTFRPQTCNRKSLQYVVSPSSSLQQTYQQNETTQSTKIPTHTQSTCPPMFITSTLTHQQEPTYP
jgi:hypothetical protein